MVAIGTQVEFEAAHRQLGDPSKCGKLHGHNWVAEVHIESHDINDIGYVVDFKDINEICNRYDHSVMLVIGDPLIDVLIEADQNVVVIPVNPTCENLAMILAGCIKEVMDSRMIFCELIKVVVWENNKSYAMSEIKGSD
ncbi:MAG: 6-carboxytetrahydropterin synthase [Methanoculleus sp.]|uniref:6-pyruvoyl trahydropterin synthase family protein n=1 Tax=Methanoculleus sp. TaxID=90427 RepID=UPI0026399B00|nr:6-carboxytetrahydropterin synthase [Methanoculleus sp.]MDD2259277.1 6-carboxytetrahydropterin synthase [Bacilli bacterium]MDD4471758.1 6-carboxytetrahydropterin synthase [Methanoculleus sp.]